MKKEMEETLDKLKKDIVSNTPFEKSSVKDHKNDKSMYEGLLQMYNASGKNDAAWERLKE
ncbi:MAG: hypothetical protein LBQ59_01435 [Candidatus Peribacteria bacterium]|jgi:hypothetical protein|nr:hypothetical protein [Candidatus Peribacteria bacterium]